MAEKTGKTARKASSKTGTRKKVAKKPVEKGGVTVPVLGLDGKKKGTVALPPVFNTPVRADLIHRAVVAAEANRRQPYGSDPLAGTRHSVEWPGKGRGMARTPRLKQGRRAAFVPNAVGGRRAFPPLVEKDYSKKVNVKERRLARASALAATVDPEIVAARGHRFSGDVRLPLVISDEVEDVDTTKKAVEVLEKLGVAEDLERVKEGRHVRAGRGKMRGRRYKQPRGPLLVLAPEEGGTTRGKARGFRNLPGMEVVSIHTLGTHHLAPGGHPGRLTIYTERAVKYMERWS
ncbi:MAG: 50S ribosomal protein L4 [Thermoplasmata archaeon]|nr:50S ribosomal protein L4 [Thermoplasmata archaeon]